MKRSFFLLCVLCSASTKAQQRQQQQASQTVGLSMPHVYPEKPETYLCTAVRLDPTTTNYVIGFRPKAEARTAHHMLLFGCKNPGLLDAPVFTCGAMTERSTILPAARDPCGGGGGGAIYAWAKNAPELVLPDDVAFRVGGPDGEVNWLVLQVHYASVDNIPAEGDVSGIEVVYTDIQRPKSAGVLVMGTGGRIPAGSTTHMEVACPIKDEDKVIHPFAFRVHTHELGTVVSGWKVVGGNQWSLIGKEDPQLPQMFYPVADPGMTLSRGDVVAARCTMVNFRDHTVWAGSTKQDEMCNFYLMYWVEEGKGVLAQKTCVSTGPPGYYWAGAEGGGVGLSNIPEVEASKL